MLGTTLGTFYTPISSQRETTGDKTKHIYRPSVQKAPTLPLFLIF
jgi:hypothetical protein